MHIVEPESTAASLAAFVEIALPNGRVVRVAPGFDATTLTRVLTLASTEEERC